LLLNVFSGVCGVGLDSPIVVGEDHVPDFAKRLPTTRAALAYAARKHDGQRRQVDGNPFILHPLEVASLLHQSGAPDRVIAAGVLHDTLEKTDATAAELSQRFGARVTALVLAVSEDDRISGYGHRKAALRDQVIHCGREALIVFAADKLSKVRELRLVATAATPVRRRRLTHYHACLHLLQDHLPDSPLVQALQTELADIPEPTPRRRTLASAGARAAD
jgi:(p)ppGpp synthase/HD superfamily hydrolase